ncbi:MAG: type II secretion system F family protein [Actinobacteria bacterium]|nr:type II secretion system F family protein [Actinomycetota bacterium]
MNFYTGKQGNKKNNLIIFLNSLTGKLGSLFSRFFKTDYKQKNSYFLELFFEEKNIEITFNVFLGYKILIMILFSLAGMFVSSSIVTSILLTVSGGILGFWIPDIFLRRYNSRRLEKLNNDLPYVIDLLYISTLSGQNIYNSIRIIIEKYKGNIGIELKKILKDIDFGIGKFEAFKNFISRNDTENLKNLLFILLQAEKYGSSISEILNQKSEQIKFEEAQNFEKKSRKISVFIIFPLVFLILPAFILLVGGPLIFSVGGSFLFS